MISTRNLCSYFIQCWVVIIWYFCSRRFPGLRTEGIHSHIHKHMHVHIIQIYKSENKLARTLSEETYYAKFSAPASPPPPHPFLPSFRARPYTESRRRWRRWLWWREPFIDFGTWRRVYHVRVLQDRCSPKYRCENDDVTLFLQSEVSRSYPFPPHPIRMYTRSNLFRNPCGSSWAAFVWSTVCV